MSVRALILEAHSSTRRGSYARHALDAALRELDNSREITEKVTTRKPGRPYTLESGSVMDRFIVTSHKARVVLDD